MNRSKYILLVIPLTNIYLNASSSLNQKQSKNYIRHIVMTVFDPNMHSATTLDKLNEFVHQRTTTILNLSEQFSEYGTTIQYNANKLNCITINECVKFIAKVSKAYAYNILEQNAYRGSKSELSETIANKIKTKVENIINSNSELSHGILTNYIGTSLKNKVIDLINSYCNTTKSIKTYRSYKTITYAPVHLKPVQIKYIKPAIAIQPASYFAPTTSYVNFGFSFNL